MSVSRNALTVGYFAVIILLGLCIYQDYGVSWDESIDRVNGLVNAKYITGLVAPEWTSRQGVFANTPDFHTYDERDHGVIFHLPLAFMEVFMGGVDSRTYYFVRHLCIFLSFVLALWSVYRIALIRYGSWALGLLASTLLLVSPRIFADAFSNGKDLVLLSFFTFGAYTLVRLLQRPTVGRAVLHGAATAIATDIRILGCLLVAITLALFALELLPASSSRLPRQKLLTIVAAYCVATAAFTVVGWPYLWEAPLNNFLLAFENMKKFRWDGYILYLGEKVHSLALPWHYAPVWIIISTPIAYCVAGLLGLVAVGRSFWKGKLAYMQSLEGKIDALLLAWFFIPPALIIVLHSVIYDGWRHLYFIYPALILLAVHGGQALWRAASHRTLRPRLVWALATLAGLEMGYTVVRMVRAHPNQQVFYSFLTDPAASQLFEGDYWGLSYRKGLQWILANSTASTIAIDAPFRIVLENNLAILKPADRARFVINPNSQEVYFLTAYRTHPEPYPASVGNEVHAVKVNGIRILSVFYRW
ncbi:hypothetical protein [Hymenobacter pini]|uniref:hypothetical protein n=1 Tax=Hymenobacter pini TaxID=2880879 RepID=UPI001CF10B1F|nr:hypothetical protein [Hymenobacter pini]MCA8832426.1 hypothetical protein [Hymenobacter pini]